jgi:hypothetical protein
MGGVRDFEDTVIDWVGVEAGGVGDGRFTDLVEVSEGVRFLVLGDSVGFFVGEGVGVAVDCGVDTFTDSLVRC